MRLGFQAAETVVDVVDERGAVYYQGGDSQAAGRVKIFVWGLLSGIVLGVAGAAVLAENDSFGEWLEGLD